MKELIIDETTTTVTTTTTTIEEYPATGGERLAFELGRQLGRIEAMISSIEKSFERLNRYASTDPEQVEFEAKYHAGRCSCVQCEERRQEV